MTVEITHSRSIPNSTRSFRRRLILLLIAVVGSGLLYGVRHWKRGRYGYGQLLLVNDLLLIQSESGRVSLVRTGPDAYEEVATLDALRDRTWNHPTLAGKYLLLRNDREAVCYELPQIGPEH